MKSASRTSGPGPEPHVRLFRPVPSSDPTRSSGQHRTAHAGEDSCAHAALFSGAGPAPSLCVRSSGAVGRCRCCSARLPPPSRRPTLPTPPTLPSEQLPGAGPSPSLSDLSAGVWRSHKVVLKAQTAYLANNRRETCHVLVLI